MVRPSALPSSGGAKELVKKNSARTCELPLLGRLSQRFAEANLDKASCNPKRALLVPEQLLARVVKETCYRWTGLLEESLGMVDSHKHRIHHCAAVARKQAQGGQVTWPHFEGVELRQPLEILVEKKDAVLLVNRGAILGAKRGANLLATQALQMRQHCLPQRQMLRRGLTSGASLLVTSALRSTAHCLP